MSAELTPTRVFALCSTRLKVTAGYLVQRLAEERLLDGIITVQPPGVRHRWERVHRIRQKRGWRGVIKRWRANRLRTQLLSMFREEYLVKRLCSRGVDPTKFPRGVRIINCGELNAPATARAITALQPRLLIQAGAGWVRKPLLNVPEIGILSLHHGIMPDIRGMDSILWACVENRPDWIGVTVQLLDERLDTGRIVNQACVPRRHEANPYSLVADATILGADLMRAAVCRVLERGVPEYPSASSTTAYRSALTSDAIRRIHELCVGSSSR